MKIIEMWWWWWENNRNVVVVVVKAKQWKCGGGGAAGGYWYFFQTVRKAGSSYLTGKPRQAYCAYCSIETLISKPIPN